MTFLSAIARIFLSAKYLGRNAVNTKKGRAYRFNMEITLAPDRQAYLIDVLLMLGGGKLAEIAEALRISANKLMNVRQHQDFLTKKEAEQVYQLLVLLSQW
jgi:hypothetical protein